MSSSCSWESENRKIRSNGKLSTPRAEEGYCNEATQSRQSKPPSPKYIQTYRGKTKNGLGRGRNKRSDMVLYLYVLQKVSYRRCMKYGDGETQTVGRTWMQRNSQTRKTTS